jgi:antitoxin (DNA-binding transcriptional repressor) of toxin-antitoxin stability system
VRSRTRVTLINMTAAFADDEYEVPLHGAPPAEAVERAEHGNVVYLTRDGERVAAVVPPNVATERGWAGTLSTVRAIADNPERSPGLRAWARAQAVQIEELLKAATDLQQALEDEEDIEDAKAVLASVAAGGATTPHDLIVRRYG